MATGLTGAPIHSGSWFGLPDVGLTEWLQGQKTTSPSPTGLINRDGTPAQPPTIDPSGGQNALAIKGATATPTPTPQSSGGGGRMSELEKMGSTRNPVQQTEYDNLKKSIDSAAGSQGDAAQAAAEARRQAALHAYEGKVAAAGVAKEQAKGQYDWIIETLGSNKKDLLDQVALNEKTGAEGYAKNETDTRTNYDKARQEILSTYRDLSLQQEKILRGTGVGSSSRSQEASLRLNNLMGKDLSETSQSEADSLALIGNALSTFKEKIVQTKNSIETETKSKLDKAALDYDGQVKAIDANTQLAANEREDAYAAAEAQLAQDTANIQSWATGLKLQAEQTMANTKETLDNFVVDMTDSNGLLNGSLDEKKAATDSLVQEISTSVTLDKEGNIINPAQGTRKTTKVKTLADLYAPEGTTPGMVGSSATLDEMTGQNISQKVKTDPLLGALMA